jgi:hypothetical protein
MDRRPPRGSRPADERPGRPAPDAPTGPGRRGGRLLAGVVLLAMLLVGLFMWAGNPYLWIRVTAARADSQSLSLGQAAFVLVAIAATGFASAKLLAVLNAVYARAMGGTDEVTIRAPWTRAMSDGRDTGRTTSALDAVMVVSVASAIVVASVWFFFFATYG